jgi:hypothetical protein
VTRPLQVTLVVDDIGVKYVGKDHAEQLIRAIKSEGYDMMKDWTGILHCGTTLACDYDTKTLDISVPGYIEKLLLKFK